MGEFAGLPPFASGVTIHHQTQGAAPPAVPAVEASLPGQATGGQAHGHGSGDRSAPQTAPQQERRPDPHALTGPPPAFRASVLDLERDLAQIIARLQATRSLREGERATADHAADGAKPPAASPGDPDPKPPRKTEFPSADSMLPPDPADPARPEQDAPDG